MNDGMPGKMEERPPIVPALKEVVADLLREGADRFILPRFQNLSSQEIATKSSRTDFVTIADQETEAWLYPDYSKHSRVLLLARKPPQCRRVSAIKFQRGLAGR